MKIYKDSFFSIGSDLKISKEQLEVFWTSLEKSDSTSNAFTKYLFYFGALIVIGAMTWFMNLSWEQFGGGGMFLIATAYACIFTLMGGLLWSKKDLRTPAGLLITIAVCMVPLAIYGLETYFNFWPIDHQYPYNDFFSWVEGRWIYMSLGTILAGVVALYFFPFPFLTAPIFFAAWFLMMDGVSFIFDKNLNGEEAAWVSLCFGLILIAIGFIIDREHKGNYSFWSYFFGTLSFWIGLNILVWDKGELILFLYLIISLMMMFFSILLRRNVLMVFGAIGVFMYLSYLSYSVFKDSILFPFALSFIGLAMIYLGILYQRNVKWIEENVFEKLPESLKKIFL